ncbi:MAG: DUF4981 domain-containing protein [Vallitalea sp.]|jgi:beta-galactosidase|nr:DUF4981 domain-containing protein [Vallitalea sp.]
MTDTKEDNLADYKRLMMKKLTIDDYYIRAKATNQQYTNWLLDLDVHISNKVLGLQPVNIELIMYDEDEERFLGETKIILKENETYKITLEAMLNNMKIWSEQNPYEYMFKLLAKDEKDNIICEQLFSYGFRFVGLRNKKIFINGSPVMLNGVIYNNYEDKSEEELVDIYYEDIKILKKHNVNTIVTYDHKNAQILYDMCNKHGIYVISKLLKHNMYVETESKIDLDEESTIEIIKKYRNNPCIIMWSIDDKVQWARNNIDNLKNIDNTRQIYYESNNKLMKDQNKIEFSYNLIDRSNHVYIDEREKEIAGEIIGNFIIDNSEDEGLVDSNRKITPFAYEIKKEYELIEIRPKDIIKGFFTIKNKGDSNNLTNYLFMWEILEDGIIIKQGIIPDIWIVPHSQQEININYNLDKILENTHYHININVLTKEPTWYTSKDYCVAWAQFAIPYKLPKRKKSSDYSDIRVRDRKLKVEIYGDNFEIVIDKLKGNIRSMEFDNKEYIISPMEVYIQNEQDNIELSKVKNVIINESSGMVQIEVIKKYSAIKGYVKTMYIVKADGKITIENRISSNNKHVKVGFLTKIWGGFNDFSWLGKGPYNTYHNKNYGTKVGLYYYNLQDCAQNTPPNKSGTIWAALTDCDGEGILIESSRQILFTICPKLESNIEDEEEGEIFIDACCSSKAQHTIFDSKGKREDVYGISIRRLI